MLLGNNMIKLDKFKLVKSLKKLKLIKTRPTLVILVKCYIIQVYNNNNNSNDN